MATTACDCRTVTFFKSRNPFIVKHIYFRVFTKFVERYNLFSLEFADEKTLNYKEIAHDQEWDASLFTLKSLVVNISKYLRKSCLLNFTKSLEKPISGYFRNLQHFLYLTCINRTLNIANYMRNERVFVMRSLSTAFAAEELKG